VGLHKEHIEVEGDGGGGLEVENIGVILDFNFSMAMSGTFHEIPHHGVNENHDSICHLMEILNAIDGVHDVLHYQNWLVRIPLYIAFHNVNFDDC
jgi:hypothetical protein